MSRRALRRPVWWYTAVWLMTASAVIASVYAARLVVQLRDQRAQMAALVGRMAVLQAPDMIDVWLDPSGPAPAAAGRAYVSLTHGVVFTAKRLPVLADGESYHLWVVAGMSTLNVGAFEVASDGSVAMTLPMPKGASGDVASVFVTQEARRDVATPAGARVLGGDVER